MDHLLHSYLKPSRNDSGKEDEGEEKETDNDLPVVLYGPRLHDKELGHEDGAPFCLMFTLAKDKSSYYRLYLISRGRVEQTSRRELNKVLTKPDVFF